MLGEEGGASPLSDSLRAVSAAAADLAKSTSCACLSERIETGDVKRVEQFTAAELFQLIAAVCS